MLKFINEIGEFDSLYDRGTERFYGDNKILICPVSKPKNPLSSVNKIGYIL